MFPESTVFARLTNDVAPLPATALRPPPLLGAEACAPDAPPEPAIPNSVGRRKWPPAGAHNFVVGGSAIRRDATPTDRKRHKPVAVRLRANRCGMIGRNENSVIAVL